MVNYACLEVDGNSITTSYTISLLFPEWSEAESDGPYKITDAEEVESDSFKLVEQNGVFEIHEQRTGRLVPEMQAFARSDVLSLFETYVQERNPVR